IISSREVLEGRGLSNLLVGKKLAPETKLEFSGGRDVYGAQPRIPRMKGRCLMCATCTIVQKHVDIPSVAPEVIELIGRSDVRAACDGLEISPVIVLQNPHHVFPADRPLASSNPHRLGAKVRNSCAPHSRFRNRSHAITGQLASDI